VDRRFGPPGLTDSLVTVGVFVGAGAAVLDDGPWQAATPPASKKTSMMAVSHDVRRGGLG
jgi:hypothetical protein